MVNQTVIREIETAQKKVEEEGASGGAGSKPTVKDDKKNMKEAKK